MAGRSLFCLVFQQIERGKKYSVPDKVSMEIKEGYRVAYLRKSVCLDRLSRFRWKTIVYIKNVEVIFQLRDELSILAITPVVIFLSCVSGLK